MYFPKTVQSKIARTGIPIRKALMAPALEGAQAARSELGLDAAAPTILVLGGSLGAGRINDAVLSALPDLVAYSNVIHQTGPSNLKEVEKIADVVLADNPHQKRYRAFGYLSEDGMRRAAGAADLVVSRAGATSIAEIALWGKPSIIIPIPEAISHDQRSNAYAYARTGAASVIEQENLTPHLLAAEAKHILESPTIVKDMSEKARTFTDPDAAKVIAEAALQIALSHEQS